VTWINIYQMNKLKQPTCKWKDAQCYIWRKEYKNHSEIPPPSYFLKWTLSKQKNIKYQMLSRMWRYWTILHCWLEHICLPVCSFCEVIQKNQIRVSKRHLHSHFHGIVIYTQEVETT
jgi:hypothetical protein